jgi:RimJ/RimL family protein N-acetyltransferase
MSATIEGKKIILRELRAGDLPLVTGWINRPEVAYFMGIPAPISFEQQKRWFKITTAGSDKKVFAIVLRRTGRHVGNISLHAISARNRNAALNIFIGEPADRGKGYAREAIMLLLGYSFGALGMHRVYLTLHSENKAAYRLYKFCGMKKEGLLREHERYSGKYVDKIVMGILKDEYKVLMNKVETDGK